jgi:DnaJ-class molecular chaperone
VGLLNAFNEWRNSKYENHISQMREGDKCPDCYGRGVLIYPSTGISFYTNILDCPGCNGTGMYAEWETSTLH